MTEPDAPDPWSVLRSHLSPNPDEEHIARSRRPQQRTMVIAVIAVSVAFAGAGLLIARPAPARSTAGDAPRRDASSTSLARRPSSPSRPGGVVTTSAGRFEVGGPSDRVVLGDWDCDGEETPAVLVTGTGEVFSFSRWADESTSIDGRLVRVVADADDISAIQGDADGCAELEVRRADGSTLVVEVPS